MSEAATRPARSLMLSTCGTSLLTHRTDRPTQQRLTELANAREEALSDEDRCFLDERIADQEALLRKATTEEARKLSAELNGLLAYYGGRLPPPAQAQLDIHWLLHTDTYQGRRSSELLRGWLEAHGFATVQLQTFGGLRTDDLADFQAALSDLARWCAEMLPGYRKQGHRVIFNLSGGFKSIQGFLQTLGMFYADETLYLFEAHQELLRIPRLPVTLDLEESVRNNLELFRRMALGEELPLAECRDIPETLLLVVDDGCRLSAWGQLAWAETHRLLQAEKLLPPLHTLSCSNQFHKDVEALPRDRRAEVNQRLDQLAHLLADRTATGWNPRHLDFKQLQGNPAPPSTHECDAWAGGAAMRIFGHFDNAGYVVDCLHDHL